MTQRTDSVQSFLTHADKIDILVPTWYSVDETGLVWGGPDERVMQAARQHNVAVMPIIVNSGLQGFCSWVLGQEDPAIWDLLPSHP
jgi:spore germination protein YaaH